MSLALVDEMTGVIEVEARAALVRVTCEFGVPVGETRKLNPVTDLTLVLGKVSHFKILAVVFLVTGRAGELANFQMVHGNRGAGPQ